MKKLLLVVFLLFHIMSWSQDVSKDIAMGKEGLAMVEQQMGIYTFEALDTLLQRIGQNLVSQIEKPLFPYEFHLVDSPEPNAFALPGGKIFVTRGLLILPLCEDELAGVIGHEIIHSNNRHSIKQQNNSVWGTLIAIPGLIIGGIFQGPIGQAVASPFLMGNELLTSSYSRGHEKEADKYGIELAAKAGYDPHQLAKILDRLKGEAEYLTGEEEKKSYLASHPYTPKRIEAIEKNSEKYVPATTGFKLKENEFLPLFDELLLTENPDYGFISDSVFYHPKKLLRIDLHAGWDHAITPTTFGMASKKRDAIITLSVLPDTVDAKKFMERMEEAMKKEANVSPSKSEKMNWYGYNGQMLEFVSNSNQEKIKLQVFAIDYKGNEMIKLVALFKADAESSVAGLLENARVISQQELPKSEIEILHVVKASENESLADLIAREGAEEFTELIAIINDKKPDNLLKSGEFVKIIKKEYRQF